MKCRSVTVSVAHSYDSYLLIMPPPQQEGDGGKTFTPSSNFCQSRIVNINEQWLTTYIKLIFF